MKLSLSRSVEQISLSKSLFLLLTLLLGVVVALWQLIPPAVIPVSAPLREFSAQRAMQHLEVIAQKPRPNRFEALTNIPFTTLPMVFTALLFGLMLPHFLLLKNGFSPRKLGDAG